MMDILNELDWAEPIIPRTEDPEWETKVRRKMGIVPDIMTRVSTNHWLREVLLKSLRLTAHKIPSRLADISNLICAQENACRYCYGIARSQLKLFGYTDRMINGIEQDLLLAELDQKDRIFIKFCRSLARSSPRPAKTEREKLISLGFSPLEVSEIAFQVARECFNNRVITFISSPPMYDFERLTNSIWGRMLRPLIAQWLRSKSYHETQTWNITDGPLARLIQPLQGIPGAVLFQEGFEAAFESNVLSPELKILMLAVVARALSCKYCNDAACQMAFELGFKEDEYLNTLATLTSSRLDEQERLILAWTRDTVHYQTGPMQRRMKELAVKVNNDKLLEAVGFAALANSIVRLGVLQE